MGTVRALKTKRDAYVRRLNAIYGGNLDKSKVELFRGRAAFEGPDGAVRVGDDLIKAKHTLVAVGGRPSIPPIPGPPSPSPALMYTSPCSFLQAPSMASTATASSSWSSCPSNKGDREGGGDGGDGGDGVEEGGDRGRGLHRGGVGGDPRDAGLRDPPSHPPRPGAQE